jgi:hypothetical protein
MMDQLGDEDRSAPGGPPGAASPEAGPARAIGRGMAAGAGVTIVLIAYGVWRFPSVVTVPADAPLAVCAGIGIAILYAIVGRIGPRTPGLRDPSAMRQGVRFGLVAGAIFAASMLAEYLVPHDHRQNVLLAKATFGLFFAMLAAAGFAAALATRRATAGPPAAFWAALIASQLWFILLLTIYYAFIGTPLEDRFLEIDQVLADFRRSGMSDLRAFIFEDYMGGGFFHSLLGPLLALPLGGLGGLVAGGLLILKRVYAKPSIAPGGGART